MLIFDTVNGSEIVTHTEEDIYKVNSVRDARRKGMSVAKISAATSWSKGWIYKILRGDEYGDVWSLDARDYSPEQEAADLVRRDCIVHGSMHDESGEMYRYYSWPLNNLNGYELRAEVHKMLHFLSDYDMSKYSMDFQGRDVCVWRRNGTDAFIKVRSYSM